MLCNFLISFWHTEYSILERPTPCQRKCMGLTHLWLGGILGGPMGYNSPKFQSHWSVKTNVLSCRTFTLLFITECCECSECQNNFGSYFDIRLKDILTFRRFDFCAMFLPLTPFCGVRLLVVSGHFEGPFWLFLHWVGKHLVHKDQCYWTFGWIYHKSVWPNFCPNDLLFMPLTTNAHRDNWGSISATFIQES